LKSLAVILRYSLYKSNRIVNIKNEVDWLNQYLYIQKTRFYNSFDYIINIAEEIMGYKIYKLLLQPFIENAIIHGFGGQRPGGTLKVSGQIHNEEFIRFTIEDNGKGMSDEKLSQLNGYVVQDYIANQDGGIGIANVLNRLKIYYGAKWEFYIDSIPGSGTCITLIVPKIV